MSRGQLDHPLNWILVLFGGAFFLLLLIALAKVMLDAGESREEAATLQAVTNMVDKTKNNPDTRLSTRLPEMQAYCDDGLTLITGQQSRDFVTHAVFIPPMIEGGTTIWSREFKLHHVMTTMTYFFPEDTQYVFVPEDDFRLTALADKASFLNYDLLDASDSGSAEYPYDVVVFLTTTSINDIDFVPRQGQEAYAIYYDGSGEIKFYQYENDWGAALGTRPVIDETFLYGALAARTPEQYDCAYAVAEERTRFVAEINLERVQQLKTPTYAYCWDAYDRAANAYEILISTGLTSTQDARNDLSRASRKLRDVGCPTI